MRRFEFLVTHIVTLRPNFFNLTLRRFGSDSRYLTSIVNTHILLARNYSDDKEKSDKKDGGHHVSGRADNPAKKKLHDLLKSIVKDSEIRKDEESKQASAVQLKKVDMKLAGYSRKVNLEKSQQAKAEKTVEAEDSKGPGTPKELSTELLKAVKDVAGILEGDPEITETELVHKLKVQAGSKISMSELFIGMKIDRTKPDTTVATPLKSGFGESRAEYVRKQIRDHAEKPTRQGFGVKGIQRREGNGDRSRQRERQPYQYIQIGLFQSKPLGIFSVKPNKPAPQVPTLSTWDSIHNKELKLAVTHPPANGFEEMILWTEQGKLWKFPIDNEYEIGEESKVGFQDHVFLHLQLDPWCPKKGPIRHFMEIVCTALGKNSYLTAREKRENIEWYHSYFKEKAAIVKEVGAGTIQ